jgi:hypothetical protein
VRESSSLSYKSRKSHEFPKGKMRLLETCPEQGYY